MLFETVNQSSTILLFLFSGFLSGFLFDIKNILNKIIKNCFLHHFFAFLATFIFLFIYFIVNLIKCYGEIRFFPFIIFLMSFFMERVISNVFVAKHFVKCYNKKRKDKNEKQVVEKS